MRKHPRRRRLVRRRKLALISVVRHLQDLLDERVRGDLAWPSAKIRSESGASALGQQENGGGESRTDQIS